MQFRYMKLTYYACGNWSLIHLDMLTWFYKSVECMNKTSRSVVRHTCCVCLLILCKMLEVHRLKYNLQGICWNNITQKGSSPYSFAIAKFQFYNLARNLDTLLTLSVMVAHGRMVTSSRQITEVKQRRARLVLGWVTAARSSHATGHV